jgi:UDP-glucose 4-epimerase
MVINLGGIRPVSHIELIKSLIEIAGSGSYRLVPFPEKRKRIDIGDVYSSYELARTLLGWEPRVDLTEGLERTIEFYRENREAYW